MDGADDLAAVYALQVDARDAEVRVSELPLDHDQRHTFVRHLDRMGVSQSVGRKPPSHAGGQGRVMQLFARGRRFPMSSGGRSVDYAHQCADRKLAADLEPGVELVPCPAVHPDLAALATLPVLCRGDGYAEFGVMWLGCRGQGGVELGITSGCGSQVVEEGDQAVGGSVAAGAGGWWRGAVDCSLLEAEIAVQVSAGGAFLFVTEPECDHGRADVRLQERHRGLDLPRFA